LYFPSKKDLWFGPIIWGTIIACILPILTSDYVALFFTLPIAIILVWVWFSTGYRVIGELLIIRSGPLTKSIPIKDIEKITQTKNLVSSFALSIDRLEIIYGSNFGLTLVSPKDKQKFVFLLKSINPKIKADENLN
jgi:hypothetical protein